MTLDDGFIKILEQLPTKDVHPMAWLRTAVSAMALWDPEAQDMSEEANFRKGVRLSAKMGLWLLAFTVFVKANS